jgi:four helix bundle protein
MAKGDNIQERLIDFAVEVITLTTQFPKTPAGRHIADQLLRSGTSPAPNYAEARSAESYNDFIHKLKIALKELNETRIWLEIIQRSNLVPENIVIDVFNECNELCRIISASIKTAIQNRNNY